MVKGLKTRVRRLGSSELGFTSTKGYEASTSSGKKYKIFSNDSIRGKTTSIFGQGKGRTISSSKLGSRRKSGHGVSFRSVARSGGGSTG